MKIRIVSLALWLVALVVFISAPVTAQQEKGKGNTHEGTFISAKGLMFTMADKAGKKHDHTLSIKGKVRCDGKECKLADLKRGVHITVTTLKSDPKVATLVEARSKNKK